MKNRGHQVVFVRHVPIKILHLMSKCEQAIQEQEDSVLLTRGVHRKAAPRSERRPYPKFLNL